MRLTHLYLRSRRAAMKCTLVLTQSRQQQPRATWCLCRVSRLALQIALPLPVLQRQVQTAAACQQHP